MTALNQQPVAPLSQNVFVPPPPAQNALPPVFPPQQFNTQYTQTGQSPSAKEQLLNKLNQEAVKEQQEVQNVADGHDPNFGIKQGVNAKHLKAQKDEINHINFVTPSPISPQEINNEQEEVSLST